MHQETELLVAAIESLKQQPNNFKDYVYPIASAFFTSVLGATIAYFALKFQEGVQIEKEKMDAANKWTLKAEQARSELLAIKGNYHGQLENVPFQRLSAIPSILIHANTINEDYQDLSFIVPKAKDNEQDPHKWSQIPRIRSMISNYNYLLKLWEQRTELNQEFKNSILNSQGNHAYIKLSQQSAETTFGKANLLVLIDLTERVIKLTDDILVELDSFLEEFPEYVKSKIKVKRLNKYGSILAYKNDGNKLLLNLLEKSPEVDLTHIEELFGESSNDVKERHKTGYE